MSLKEYKKHKERVPKKTQPEKVECTSAIPIIDISSLETKQCSHSTPYQTREYQNCLKQIKNACEKTGFFLIKGHSISQNTIFNLQMSARRFFSLSEKEKMKVLIGSNGSHCGYVPFSESGQYQDEGSKRLYEAFDLSLDLGEKDPDYINGHLFYGPNLWPDIPYFKERVDRYYQQITKLSLVLVTAFESILEMPETEISSKMHKPTNQLRLIHYIEDKLTSALQPYNNNYSDSEFNMGAHTDYELFTMLFFDEIGLQTQNISGDWIDVPFVEGALVVNIGDMLEVWSNGRFKSNLHRVSNLGVERYSFPFFAALDYDAVIEPWTINNEASNYESVKAGEHLQEQVTSDFAYLRNAKKMVIDKAKMSTKRNNPFERSKTNNKN